MAFTIPFNLDFTQAIAILQPLLFLVAGIVVYSIFIFNFYKFISKRDIITVDLKKYAESRFGFVKAFLRAIIFVFENILFIPLFAFFWFGIITVLLVFLAKEHSVSSILMASMGVVAAIRIASYYKEDLAQDLAKTLPLALLSLYIIEMTTFSISGSLETFLSIPSQWETLVYYLLFLIILEFLMKIVEFIVGLFKKE